MRKVKKKWLYRALCAALAVTLVSGTAVMSPIADIIGTNITANAANYTTWGTCQWKVENGKLYIKGTIPNTGGPVDIPWCAGSIRATITEVYVEKGTKTSANVSYLFYNLTKATSMNLSNLDTSAATDMHHMFNYCNSLASLNTSGWNTSKVTNMWRMFYYCKALTSLDLSSWNTSSVKTMEDMFYGCNALTSLNLSNWNTKNVTTMAYMFYGCNSLKSVDVNGWNTQNVTSMFCMFSGCNALKKIYADKDWNTSNVTSEYSMFGNCENLVGGKGTAWSNTKKTTEYARIDGGPESTTPGYFTEGHAPLTYTVTWKNYDGTTLETDEDVEEGTTPSYDGATPTKTATAQYSYTFSGWNKEITAVTGDVTYTAQFTETTNTYTVTWIDGDGNTLTTDTVAYGETPVYSGATPTKTATAQYSYTFSGWDKEITAVTGNATYTAQFTETTNTYTVTWVDGDGNTTTDTIGYGTTPSYDGEKPTKASDKNYIYKFRGWTDGTNTYTAENLPAVGGNVTYTAVYDALPIIHSDDVFVNSTESTPQIFVTDPFTKEILTEGTDYTVKVNNSTVTVTGINSYAGGVQKSYTTLSRDMKASITNRRKTGTNAKATLSGEWYLPKNATNIQAGIARLSTDDTAVTNYDVYKNGVKKASALKTTSGKYSFSLLMNSTHANQNLYTVTYVTYEIDGVPFVSISKAFTGYPNPA